MKSSHQIKEQHKAAEQTEISIKNEWIRPEITELITDGTDSQFGYGGDGSIITGSSAS